MLQRICHQDIDLCLGSRKSDESVKVGRSKEPFRSAEFQEQLQQLTNTIIEPSIASMASDDIAKVRIYKRPFQAESLAKWNQITVYFLGPSTDDFQDAKRLLLRSLRSPGFNKAIAVFGGSQNSTAIALVPIQIGTGLPFVQRIREWSRWTKVIKREQDIDAVRSELRATTTINDDDMIVQKSAARWIEKHQGLLTGLLLERPSSVAPSPHWQDQLRYSRSVTIGRVIYPRDVVQRVQKKIIARWEKGRAFSPNMWKKILGPHEFLSSRNGRLPSFFEKFSRKREFLAIKLNPKEKNVPAAPSANDGDSSSRAPKYAPELEIHLEVDRDRQKIASTAVSAVFRSKKSDLMLPQESNDLRFVTEQYAISSANLDPNLQAFIEASNLAVWGSERLKTPLSLVLDVPRVNGKDQDHTEHQGLVEYDFASLEHRTQLFVVQGDFHYEHTMIEAGQSGGQREEFRIHLLNQSQEESPQRFRKLFEEAKKWISEMSQSAKRPLFNSVLKPDRSDDGELKFSPEGRHIVVNTLSTDQRDRRRGYLRPGGIQGANPNLAAI